MRSNGPDISIENHGSLFLARPLSPAGHDWLEEHLPEDTPVFGDAVAIEHRFICDIVDGMQADGLEVSR